MVMSGVKHLRGFLPARHESNNTTQALGDEIIIYVATFVSYRDLCTLGHVCRRFAPLPAYDLLWEQHALAIVRSPQQLRTAVSVLNISSNRQVVEIFKRIGIPRGVLGLWRADGPMRSWSVNQQQSGTQLPQQGPTAVENDRAQGELLRMSLVAGGFLCESIAPNGSSHCVFAIRASTTPQGIKLGFFSLENDSFSTMGGHDWTPGQSILEAFLERASAIPSAKERTPIRPAGDSSFLLCRSDGQTQRFSMIDPPSRYQHPASLCTGQGLGGRIANAGALCGLWCAPYGSHGFEIIHISLNPPPQEADVSGLVAGIEGASGSPKVRCRSTGSSCSSGKTTFGESTCTSEPVTDSSDSGSGESCSSMESDDSSEEEEEGREVSPTGRPRTHAMTASPGFRGGGGGRSDGTSGRDDFDYLIGSDDDDDGEAMVIDSVCDTRPSNDDHSAAPFLYGVKVTGDVNVPAGKVSFAVDLGKLCDPAEELEADTRPVILFLPTGPVMANLANRGNQIAFWCKGRGRINRTPGRWIPESEEVDFIVYRPGSRYGFSVIFRQRTHVLRVIMDFERALSSSEEWPQWPHA